MPRPYSNDFRRKIVERVEKGLSCRQVADLFGVSVSFVIKLMQRFRATGDVLPAQFGGFKTSPLLAHEQDVRGWIAATPELTVGEICTRFAERDVKTSPAAVARFLQKIGLTRKKRPRVQPNNCEKMLPRRAPNGVASSRLEIRAAGFHR